MDSWHVPRSVTRPVVRVVHWALPYAVAGLWALVGGGSKWIESRASRSYVGTEVGKVTAIARAAQSDAHTGSSLARAHAVELAALWAHVVSMEAELMVLRRYASQPPARRNELVAEAKSFYDLRLTEQLNKHADDPAEAARQALLAAWKP